MSVLQQATAAIAVARRPAVAVLPVAPGVYVDLALGAVVASVLSFVGVGAYCWLVVAPNDDEQRVTSVVVQVPGAQRGIVLVVAALYVVVAFDALFGTLGRGLTTAVVLPAAALAVAVAGLLPVAALDLFDRTPYLTYRDVVLGVALETVVIYGGVTLGVALALHLSYWALPVGVAAVVGYHAGRPWLVEATNEVGPVPSELLASLDGTVVSAVGEDRLRLLEDDDVAHVSLVGVAPGFQRVYLTRKLLADHPPSEVEALLEHIRGNIESRRNQEATLWWTLGAATFLLAWVVSLWLLLALVPLFAVAARRLRDRVYAADAFAAERTGPGALTAALERLVADEVHSREDNRQLLFFEWFPSVADRLDRLGADGHDPGDPAATDDDDARPGAGTADPGAVDDGPDSDGADRDDWERLRA